MKVETQCVGGKKQSQAKSGADLGESARQNSQGEHSWIQFLKMRPQMGAGDSIVLPYWFLVLSLCLLLGHLGALSHVKMGVSPRNLYQETREGKVAKDVGVARPTPNRQSITTPELPKSRDWLPSPLLCHQVDWHTLGTNISIGAQH